MGNSVSQGTQSQVQFRVVRPTGTNVAAAYMAYVYPCEDGASLTQAPDGPAQWSSIPYKVKVRFNQGQGISDNIVVPFRCYMPGYYFPVIAVMSIGPGMGEMLAAVSSTPDNYGYLRVSKMRGAWPAMAALAAACKTL